MKIKKSLFTVMLLLTSQFSFSDQIQDAKVSSISVDITHNEVSFSLQGHGSSCNYSVIRFSLNTEAGKAAYSQLLTAKTTDAAIRYVNYSNSNGNCVATVVSL